MNRASLLEEALLRPPRCQAERECHYLNDKPDSDRQCMHRSKYRVGRRFYCAKHAGVMALRMLITETDYQIDGPVCSWPRGQ